MIRRDLAALDSTVFDIAVVGGGIYGVALVLEACQRGLRAALIEKNDFGGGSTGNSLRILHGGLRYLQTLDLGRFRESVQARRWYARHFPQLIQPLPCLMPLYGEGAKRPSVLRVALTLNDLLSLDRNQGLPEGARLPSGRILGRTETQEQFPSVRQEGLQGAALWYDYRMLSSERILIEMLHSAIRLGAVTANYIQATNYISNRGKIESVLVVDRLNGGEFRVRAPVVVNCAGADCPMLAKQAGCKAAEFDPASIAFNVLFDSPSLGSAAMAVAEPAPNSMVNFLCPGAHGVWAGTAHLPRPRSSVPPDGPTEQDIETFIGGLRRAVPQFAWAQSRIRKVFWGVLPVCREMSTELTVRPQMLSHSDRVQGLYSLVGIKYTTAVQVARDALAKIYAGRLTQTRDAPTEPYPTSPVTDCLIDGDRAAAMPREELASLIGRVVEEEMVMDPDDLLLRRTNWTFTAKDVRSLALAIRQEMERRSHTPSPLKRDEIDRAGAY